MKRIACINTRSGNTSDCQILLKKLREELGPENVFDLSLVTPLSVLEQTTPDQIVCCGGDGTVAWAMSALDEFIFSRTKPVIAVGKREKDMTGSITNQANERFFF